MYNDATDRKNDMSNEIKAVLDMFIQNISE